MDSYTPLRMVAEDQEDLTFIAACLQDALVPISGITYEKEKALFHLVANRFCWECAIEAQEGDSLYSRVVSGLAFHNIKEVSHKGLDLHTQHELLNLLTIYVSPEHHTISLVFSGGIEIKLTTADLLCHLKDIEEPYPTPHKPEHS